jgi:hypothetical protein
MLAVSWYFGRVLVLLGMVVRVVVVGEREGEERGEKKI